MKIVHLIDDGFFVSAPRIFCDACGDVIEQVRNAWYLWPSSGTVGFRGDIYFAHKGDCIDHVEEYIKRNHGVWPSSGELVDFILFIARSVGLDTTKPLPPSLGALR